jgi:Ubiquitin family
VQILTGRKIVIYIDPYYDQLIDIKKKIQVKEGIHPDQMILFYNGVRLQEDCNKSLDDVLYISHHLESADDSHAKNSICLFLTLRNRGG